MQKRLKAALYIRVSTEEQASEGQSADAQAEALKQYCSAYGIDIYDIYTDLGVSGKSLKDRHGLQRLLEACRKRLFDMVLVWKISRLSRNLRDLLYIIDIFERHNVFFTSCSEKFDTSTPVGRMTLQLLGSIAEFERNTIVENVKLGLKEFARKGGKASSVLGYDNIDKKLVVNEDEAKIIRLIFSLYTESGLGFSEIADYLNGMGYRTKRGSRFRGSGISYILRNPVYIGINRHNLNTESEYCIKGSHEAIIDEELWNKAQSIIPARKRKTTGSFGLNALLFKVKCMKCNSPMKVFYTCSKGKKYHYLRCRSCSNYVNEERLLKAVSKELTSLMKDKELQKVVYRHIKKNSGVNMNRFMEIETLDEEIKRLKKSKARYLALFENYKISDTKAFIDRIEEIQSRTELLERKKLDILKEAPAADATQSHEEFFDRLISGAAAIEPDAIRQLSRCLIKEITAYRTDIKIVLYL